MATISKQDFARLVWQMRQAQKAYYLSKGERSVIGQQSALKKAKDLEKRVDAILDDMTKEASQIGFKI